MRPEPRAADVEDVESLYCGNRDLALSRALDPKLQNFAPWLAVNGKRIPIGE